MARPSKKDLAEVKNRRTGLGPGRPKGDAAIINEYKIRMLNSPKSAKVLEAIFDAALNDDHKNQAAAWKIITDRIMPVSSFEQAKAAGGTPSISINITGINQPTIETIDSVDVEDVEFREEDNG
jgi:hypothetical protein